MDNPIIQILASFQLQRGSYPGPALLMHRVGVIPLYLALIWARKAQTPNLLTAQRLPLLLPPIYK